uniref:interleukin-17F-like n=1 Tax=Styela clava TaxID=7725 RepID=UPI00193AC5F9|nr:interleukin-17F-like [Styela clava]
MCRTAAKYLLLGIRIVVVIFLSELTFSVGMPLNELAIEENVDGIPPECKFLKGNQRKNCITVFMGDYVKMSQDMLSDKKFADELEVQDVRSREKRSIRKRCPKFSEQYLRRTKKVKDRSISPWKYIKNTDNKRIPKILMEARCLCNGCINIETTKEDNVNLVSIPTKTKITVMKKGKLTRKIINTGCTCVIR